MWKNESYLPQWRNIEKTYQITTQKSNSHSSPSHRSYHPTRKPNNSYIPTYVATNYSNIKLEEMVMQYAEDVLYDWRMAKLKKG